MTEEKKPESRLLDELNALGQQLSAAVKDMWESEDSRKLRQEIGDGFLEVGQQVDAAISTAQESEAAKQFSGQVKEAMDRARESELVDELEQGLVTGLKELNKGLSSFLSSIESKPPAAAEPEVDPDPEPEA